MRTMLHLAGLAAFVMLAVVALALGGMGGQDTEARLVAEGVASPVGIGLDDRGGLYVAEGEAGRVLYIVADSDPVVLAEGLGRLGGLAVGRDADVYVSCPETGDIVRVDRRGVWEVFAGGFAVPRGVHMDARGRLLVAECGLGRVVRLGPDGKREVVLAGMASPASVAVSRDTVLASGCCGVRMEGSPGWAEYMRSGKDAEASCFDGESAGAGDGGCGYLLASGPGGIVWAVDRMRNRVLRVAGGACGFRLPDSIGPVAGVAGDRDGNLLAATEDGRVWLLRPGIEPAMPLAASGESPSGGEG